MLVLAQLLKAGSPPYWGLPTDAPGKRDYALAEFGRLIQSHLEREERVLLPLAREHAPALRELTERVRREHEQLRAQLEVLATVPEAELPAALDALGRLLESHIRFEERQWFQQLQAYEAFVDALGKE
jgi:iron-sulfur cluster repair protein YtfE (RIC family)